MTYQIVYFMMYQICVTVLLFMCWNPQWNYNMSGSGVEAPLRTI